MSVVKPVNCTYNGQDEKCLLKDTCHNFRKRIVKFSSVVVHTYNPRTWESESGRSWFEARLLSPNWEKHNKMLVFIWGDNSLIKFSGEFMKQAWEREFNCQYSSKSQAWRHVPIWCGKAEIGGSLESVELWGALFKNETESNQRYLTWISGIYIIVTQIHR